MRIFLSYSRKDEEVVKVLVQGFEAARHDVWFDHDLKGGDAWWDKILDNIQLATVFVFALSDASGQSKPCVAELEYAKALRRPVVPVQVGPVASLRINPLADLQIITYRSNDALAGFEIAAAIGEATDNQQPLPDPLPARPTIPFAYLHRLARQIESTELNPAAQITAVDELHRALIEETDESVRQDILATLRNVMSKSWRTKRTEIMIKMIIHAATAPPDEEESISEPETRSPDQESDNERQQTGPPDQERNTGRQQTGPPDQERNNEPGHATPPDPESDKDPLYQPIRPETPEAEARAIFMRRIAELEQRRKAEQRTERQVRAAEKKEPWAAVSWGISVATQTAIPNQHSATAPLWRGVATPLTPPPPPPGALRAPAAQRPEIRQPVGSPTMQAVSAPPTFQAPKPSAYWVLSVIALLPTVLFGVVALYFSSQVGRLYREGTIAGATRASKFAQAWGVVGVVVNVVCTIVWSQS